MKYEINKWLFLAIDWSNMHIENKLIRNILIIWFFFIIIRKLPTQLNSQHSKTLLSPVVSAVMEPLCISITGN